MRAQPNILFFSESRDLGGREFEKNEYWARSLSSKTRSTSVVVSSTLSWVERGDSLHPAYGFWALRTSPIASLSRKSRHRPTVVWAGKVASLL